MPFQIEYTNRHSTDWKEYGERRGKKAAEKLAQLLSQEHSDWEYRVVGDDGQQVWPELPDDPVRDAR